MPQFEQPWPVSATFLDIDAKGERLLMVTEMFWLGLVLTTVDWAIWADEEEEDLGFAILTEKEENCEA